MSNAPQDGEVIRWTTVTPQGNPVFLNNKRWGHTITNHPEMNGHEQAIRRTVESSEVICQSSTWPERDVHFLKGAHEDYPWLYVKVIVDHSQGGKIITACPTDDIGQGTGVIKYVNYSNEPKTTD